jgi:hypothetical protein
MSSASNASAVEQEGATGVEPPVSNEPARTECGRIGRTLREGGRGERVAMPALQAFPKNLGNGGLKERQRVGCLTRRTFNVPTINSWVERARDGRGEGALQRLTVINRML